MAFLQNTDQALLTHQIAQEDCTRQDEKRTFAATHSRLSTPVPKENLCFTGKECGPASAVLAEIKVSVAEQSYGTAPTTDKSC